MAKFCPHGYGKMSEIDNTERYMKLLKKVQLMAKIETYLIFDLQGYLHNSAVVFKTSSQSSVKKVLKQSFICGIEKLKMRDSLDHFVFIHNLQNQMCHISQKRHCSALVEHFFLSHTANMCSGITVEVH